MSECNHNGAIQSLGFALGTLDDEKSDQCLADLSRKAQMKIIDPPEA